VLRKLRKLKWGWYITRNFTDYIDHSDNWDNKGRQEIKTKDFDGNALEKRLHGTSRMRWEDVMLCYVLRRIWGNNL
jgi:hypothetical protein